MKHALIAWAIFAGGLILLGSCDYYARWRGGWLGNGGSPTPDLVWFGVPLLLGVVAASLLWRATATVPKAWVRATTVVVQILIGFAVYVAACLWYVSETGLDSL
jgi:hypothetical protein